MMDMEGYKQKRKGMAIYAWIRDNDVFFFIIWTILFEDIIKIEVK